MNKQRWAIVAMSVGFALLALWAVCSYLMPSSVFWDDEDQRVYAEAAERQHQAGHRVERAVQSASQRDVAAAQQELQGAQQQIEVEQERLEAAQAKIAWIPRVLLVSAAAAILAGLALLAR